MATITIERTHGDFGFEARDEQGHLVIMDGPPSIGGEGSGVSPMQMLLMALGGCSGIDIVSILKKGRQRVDAFRMVIEGERRQGVDLALWKEARLVFELKGDIDPVRARRACELSMEKYCSVAETLRLAGCVITWELRIVEEPQLIS